jgi:hypothetical protein
MGIARGGRRLSRAEAEEIIGKPPGDYTTRHFNDTLPKAEDHQMVWCTDEAVLLLNFTIDDRLVHFVTIYPRPESDWQPFLRWLGL